MSFDTNNPTARLADRKWRIRHSAWLLAPIFGFGMLSFIGFVYVAFRVRSRKFWIACFVGCAGSAFTWIGESIWGSTSDGDKNGTWGAGIMMAVWVALILYAFIINRDYLRWRASRTRADAWYNQAGNGQAAQAVVNPVAPLAHSPGFLDVSAGNYYAPTAAASPLAAPIPTPPTYVSPAEKALDPQAAGMPDVNSATAETLAADLRIDQTLADKVIGCRPANGGFQNLDALATLARLQPHEIVKFRGKVTFGSPASSFPGSRRTLGAGPNPLSPHTGGRILDY